MDILLRNKREDEQEYTIHLFEYCNLRCGFCWQNHENETGLDTVLEKLEPIEKFFQKETKKKVVFNVMGGEIFSPDIFDENLLHTYKLFVEGIKSLSVKYQISVRINWVSNMVTDKVHLIDSLMLHSEKSGIFSSLVTSYDAKGRFNINEFLQFKKTVDYFGDRIKNFSMLLTKQNIQHILKNKDPYFKYLYSEGKEIYFDYYMPDQHAKIQAPSDTELLEVFKFTIDNYPNVQPIRGWLENDANKLSCRSSKLVLEDGTMCMCGNLVSEETKINIYKSPIHKDSNVDIEQSFLNKYDCLSCEYFTRCGLGCFMQHDYKFREELDECVYKLTHRYIDNVRI
jgi:radical SAM protein with 4Fe4S-binding SPASM domain